MKPRVLVLGDWYLPGRKGGGAVSAIANLIELLGDEFQFYVFTRNRDNTEDQPYADVGFDQWVPVGKAKVFYTSELSFWNIRRRIREAVPHIIYLNSFFSRLTMKILLLRKFGLLPRSAVVLAPRGELSPAALEIRPLRKWLYRKLAFFLSLYRNLVWQASSVHEKEHIRSSSSRHGSGGEANILIAPDIPSASLTSLPYSPQRARKDPGTVQFVFLSRISPIKNLHFALELLQCAEGKVDLDIYGPVGDTAYWEQCKERIRKLPDHVRVGYKGAVSSDQVVRIFSQYHFQILPTLGENFGYVILEAFAGGCPVLISDQTPWRDLSKLGIGWDLPLGDNGRWLEVIQHCVDMDQAAYELISQRSRSYFEEWMSVTPYRQETVGLFQRAMGVNVGPKEPLAQLEAAR